MRRVLRLPPALLALATCALWPSDARPAQQQEMGAALALPIITGTDPAGGATVTASTLTNLGREGITLAIQVIDGDPGESWNSSSFSCYVTAHESTVFVFEPDGPGRSKVSFECSSSDANWTSRAALLNIRQTTPFPVFRSRASLTSPRTAIASIASTTWSKLPLLPSSHRTSSLPKRTT